MQEIIFTKEVDAAVEFSILDRAFADAIRSNAGTRDYADRIVLGGVLGETTTNTRESNLRPHGSTEPEIDIYTVKIDTYSNLIDLNMLSEKAASSAVMNAGVLGEQAKRVANTLASKALWDAYLGKGSGVAPEIIEVRIPSFLKALLLAATDLALQGVPKIDGFYIVELPDCMMRDLYKHSALEFHDQATEVSTYYTSGNVIELLGLRFIVSDRMDSRDELSKRQAIIYGHGAVLEVAIGDDGLFETPETVKTVADGITMLTTPPACQIKTCAAQRWRFTAGFAAPTDGNYQLRRARVLQTI